MKNSSILIVLIIPLLFLSACKQDKSQEALEQEIKKLQEELNNKELGAYKGLKYLVRSIELSDAEERKLCEKIITADLGKLSLDETYQLVKKIIKAGKAIEGNKEDKYPTILDQLTILYDDSGNSSVSHSYWNSSVEHAFLALMHNKIGQKDKKYALYEAALVNYDSLPRNALCPLSILYKTTVLSEYGYHYIPENDLNKLIEQTKQDQIELTGNIGNTVQKDHYLALSYFFRGMVRYQMQESNKKNEAEKDLAKFSQLATKLGIDDELSVIAAVYLNSGDRDEILEKLKQLQKSKLIDKDQRKMIKKLIKEAESGEQILNPATILEAVNEKKIASHYLSTLIWESDYLSDLKKTKSGKYILQLPDNFEEALTVYEKYKNAKNILNALWD